MRSTISIPASIALLLAATCLANETAAAATVVRFPGTHPGPARASSEDERLLLENSVLRAEWSIRQGCLRPVAILHKLSGKRLALDGGQLFGLTFAGAPALKAADFQLIGEPKSMRIEARADASRLAERFSGVAWVVELQSADKNLTVTWRAALRDGANAVRQSITLAAKRATRPLASIVLVDLPAEGAEVAGTVPGSPVVAGDFFFAYEHPKSRSLVRAAAQPAGRIQCALGWGAPLQPGRPVTHTSAMGVMPGGQQRRAFLYYVERERAHPYRPFLHYNSWYDVSWGDHRMHEAECLQAVNTFGRELTQRRGVRMDSFVWDDGWDDFQTLWKVDAKNFPRGFAPLLAAAKGFGSTNGFWLSPWGGYGRYKAERLKYGREQGFEMGPGGFSLTGPKYFQRFQQTCLGMIREGGANFFKFDGISAGDALQTEAMLRLIARLRRERPDLFVSATTGTWPSPYWLWLADSTWRGAGDMGFHGKGPKREQWLNYRDVHTYRGIVRRGPLYPLNSIMNQGIAHAKRGSASVLGSDAGEMRHEIRSFFACGTCLQELYITPQMMSDRNWDDLAEAIRWSRANADVLVDTHWIGGDPAAGEVYGWASWNARKGILALRNPHEKMQSISIDVARAFELPGGAAVSYKLTVPWADAAGRAPVSATAGRAVSFQLEPFEVLVFDATPQQ